MMIQFYQTGLNRLISGKKNAYRSFTMFLMLLSCISFSALAQDITVSGKVTGSDGDGIPGVTVQVKGTSKGTQTGLDGSYTLAGVSSKGPVIPTPALLITISNLPSFSMT